MVSIYHEIHGHGGTLSIPIASTSNDYIFDFLVLVDMHAMINLHGSMAVDMYTLMPVCIQIFSPLRGASKTCN